MRIVGGEYKGRIIKPSKNFRARPTTDIAKESLFNILANSYDFSEIKVLDLFSGTGSISYEFASRGCESIVLVEKDFHHYKFIRSTINELNLDSINPVKGDVFKFIEKSTAQFDIIFADPPYDLKNLDKIPDLILSSKLLHENSLVIVEHPKNYNFSKLPQFQELRRYGNVHFSFFSKSNN